MEDAAKTAKPREEHKLNGQKLIIHPEDLEEAQRRDPGLKTLDNTGMQTEGVQPGPSK